MARAHLSGSRYVATTSPPRWRTIARAAAETPPPIPVISTAPRPEPASSEHAPCSARGHRVRRTLLPRPARRFGDEVPGRDHHELPVPTPAVLSEQLESSGEDRVDTELIDSGGRRDGAIHDHLVADRPAIHVAPDPVDDAGGVSAGDVGKGLRARQALREPVIDVIEAARHHADPHVGRPDGRIGDLTPSVRTRRLVEEPRETWSNGTGTRARGCPWDRGE